MSEATESTSTETTAVDEGDINYEGVNLARSGVEATEDGQAPGDVAEEPTETATVQTDEEKAAAASEAGRALAGRKNSLADDVKALRGENRTLKQSLDDERRAIDSWRPILDKLVGRDDLQQAVLNGTMTVAQAESTKASDDQLELKEIAEDLGYYKLKADGSPDYDAPDLTRAERFRARQEKIATRVAQPMVQPLAQQSQEARINARIEAAVAYATSDAARAKGESADPAIVRQMFTEHARKNTAWVLDDNSGNILYERAQLQSMKAGRTGATVKADTTTTERDTRIVHTEAAGGKVTGPRLTASEKALGEQYGLTDKDWKIAEAHSGVRRGWTSLTED